MEQKEFGQLIKYIPSREIEFNNGRIVKEFIVSEDELKELLTQTYTQGKMDGVNEFTKFFKKQLK